MSEISGIDKRSQVIEELKKYYGMTPYEGIEVEGSDEFIEELKAKYGTAFVISLSKRLVNNTLNTNVNPQYTPVPGLDTIVEVTRVTPRVFSTDVVDRYVEIKQQIKDLESELSGLKETLLEMMEQHDTDKLFSENGHSAWKEVSARCKVNSNYLAFEVEDIKPFIDNKTLKMCTELRVNKEQLEALVSLGRVDEEVLSLARKEEYTRVLYK